MATSTSICESVVVCHCRKKGRKKYKTGKIQRIQLTAFQEQKMKRQLLITAYEQTADGHKSQRKNIRPPLPQLFKRRVRQHYWEVKPEAEAQTSFEVRNASLTAHNQAGAMFTQLDAAWSGDLSPAHLEEIHSEKCTHFKKKTNLSIYILRNIFNYLF